MRFNRRQLWLAVISLVLLLAFLDLEWLDSYRYPIASPDFYVYYLAAQIGLAHGWAAVYDPSIYLPAITSVVGRPLPYLNPPELAWLILPLTWLPYSIAAWAWRGILTAGFGLTCLLAAPGSGRSRILHATAGALLLPVFISLVFGQVSLLITGILAVTWWLIRDDRPWLAGIALAVIFVKPQAAFVVPLALLAAGYWRVFIAWFSATALLAGVALLVVGTAVFNNMAESMAVAHGVPGPVQISLEHQLPLPLAVVAIGLVLLTSGFVLIRVHGQGPTIPMAVAILVSALVSPYINFYDVSSVLLAGWFILAVDRPRWQTWLTIAMYIPLFLTPVWPLLTVICLSGWLLSLASMCVRPRATISKIDLAA
jgi:hypothetical protein